MDEGRRAEARRVADELLGVLSLERSLGATKALLVAGLVDLHDTVAHQISVISLNAGVASSALESRPEAARDALAACSRSLA